ncbi:hypothetical protein F5Y17DRAFT_455111 [Xylariaceae sp. FL0594]|nr:hypothetical protein F5Y17DRAFT_455111 [Xylariaceae sp. FL0594]
MGSGKIGGYLVPMVAYCIMMKGYEEVAGMPPSPLVRIVPALVLAFAALYSAFLVLPVVLAFSLATALWYSPACTREFFLGSILYIVAQLRVDTLSQYGNWCPVVLVVLLTIWHIITSFGNLLGNLPRLGLYTMMLAFYHIIQAVLAVWLEESRLAVWVKALYLSVYWYNPWVFDTSIPIIQRIIWNLAVYVPYPMYLIEHIVKEVFMTFIWYFNDRPENRPVYMVWWGCTLEERIAMVKAWYAEVRQQRKEAAEAKKREHAPSPEPPATEPCPTDPPTTEPLTTEPPVTEPSSPEDASPANIEMHEADEPPKAPAVEQEAEPAPAVAQYATVRRPVVVRPSLFGPSFFNSHTITRSQLTDFHSRDEFDWSHHEAIFREMMKTRDWLGRPLAPAVEPVDDNSEPAPTDTGTPVADNLTGKPLPSGDSHDTLDQVDSALEAGTLNEPVAEPVAEPVPVSSPVTIEIDIEDAPEPVPEPVPVPEPSYDEMDVEYPVAPVCPEPAASAKNMKMVAGDSYDVMAGLTKDLLRFDHELDDDMNDAGNLPPAEDVMYNAGNFMPPAAVVQYNPGYFLPPAQVMQHNAGYLPPAEEVVLDDNVTMQDAGHIPVTPSPVLPVAFVPPRPVAPVAQALPFVPPRPVAPVTPVAFVPPRPVAPITPAAPAKPAATRAPTAFFQPTAPVQTPTPIVQPNVQPNVPVPPVTPAAPVRRRPSGPVRIVIKPPVAAEPAAPRTVPAVVAQPSPSYAAAAVTRPAAPPAPAALVAQASPLFVPPGLVKPAVPRVPVASVTATAPVYTATAPPKPLVPAVPAPVRSANAPVYTATAPVRPVAPVPVSVPSVAPVSGAAPKASASPASVPSVAPATSAPPPVSPAAPAVVSSVPAAVSKPPSSFDFGGASATASFSFDAPGLRQLPVAENSEKASPPVTSTPPAPPADPFAFTFGVPGLPQLALPAQAPQAKEPTEEELLEEFLGLPDTETEPAAAAEADAESVISDEDEEDEEPIQRRLRTDSRNDTADYEQPEEYDLRESMQKNGYDHDPANYADSAEDLMTPRTDANPRSSKKSRT